MGHDITIVGADFTLYFTFNFTRYANHFFSINDIHGRSTKVARFMCLFNVIYLSILLSIDNAINLHDPKNIPPEEIDSNCYCRCGESDCEICKRNIYRREWWYGNTSKDKAIFEKLNVIRYTMWLFYNVTSKIRNKKRGVWYSDQCGGMTGYEPLSGDDEWFKKLQKLKAQLTIYKFLNWCYWNPESKFRRNKLEKEFEEMVEDFKYNEHDSFIAP